ncbi:cyclic pyranopterin monophosphate synthase MoaC [Caldichromatium japonicum]|uniref:Cyclic pyranopterin monophosphate synthase n=1 Tax=Caldichromatium japonicum TaxID=2699430 RepID=A0A6G7VAJ7_9GAMM|nr:cyclic pyranopterin monophosphate synthase MoaC [Caldichromatium japonicum]QIK36878.1 cyclic pyranopterin monophosphate synthase MoaC [Caldichromatium japonicum]
MLIHFTASGAVQMVDVGDKPETTRRAVAEGRILMQPATLALIESGGHAKGDVLGVARLAGIMAAKRTADLIPLAHPLSLTHVAIDFALEPESSAVRCQATVETVGCTGVEIEALCAVEIGLLTIYDMCKAVDRGMRIAEIQLIEKSGGRSGHWQRDA